MATPEYNKKWSEKHSTISIKRETQEELKSLGGMGDSFEDVIKCLIKYAIKNIEDYDDFKRELKKKETKLKAPWDEGL